MALTRRRVLSGGEVPEGAVKLMTFLRVHPRASAEELVQTLEGGYAEAARAEATLGEICGALREEWGDYCEPPAF